MDPKALWKLSYGMYVVCSRLGDKRNGQIANTAVQVASDPLTVSVSINKKNLTHEYIAQSGVFSVSILSQNAPMTLIGQFGFKSGRDIDKFTGVNFRVGATGVPIVTDCAVGSIEAEVIGSIDAGTHTLFVGKVQDCECLLNELPMTYDYYHAVKGGKTPKNAATFLPEDMRPAGEPPKDATAVKKYACGVCGYTYDPAKGDPAAGVRPGTAFDSLRADWSCPACGADKSQFEPVKG